MSDPEIDLAFIGRALQRMTNEVGTLRPVDRNPRHARAILASCEPRQPTRVRRPRAAMSASMVTVWVGEAALPGDHSEPVKERGRSQRADAPGFA